ncbi:MAG: CPBP family glutamic-type intramembrane protease [Anaerolineae bacterium]
MFPFDSPLLGLLAGVGPTLAALIVLLILQDQAGIRELFGSLLKWRASPGWFAFVFGFWIVVPAVALGIGALLGGTPPALEKFPWGSLLPIFLMMLFSNVWEEIGWRGFALPRLQERYGDLVIVFLMGALWSLWHLPLMLNPSSPMAGLPWAGELMYSLALTVLYTWLYLHTAGSLLFVSLFHAVSNTAAFVLLEMGVYRSSYLAVVALTAVSAVSIVMVYGTRRFIRR